jgi:hypothetical protein
MISCPMCKKTLPALEKTCRTCKADVSLLVDYVANLEEGLRLAEDLTRAGHLGEAVWAYLAVLEVDPDNATARRQVGKVATAVRQFDSSAPGRRWLKQLQRRKGFVRWLSRWKEGEGWEWVTNALWFLVIVGVLLLGYGLGYYTARGTGPDGPKAEEPTRTAPEPAAPEKPSKSKELGK